MKGTGRRWLTRVIAIVAVLGLCAAGAWYVVGPDRTRTVVAQFASVNGIYPGSKVAVLGLPLGTVEEVRPAGRVVEVTMTVPTDVTLPADVSAFVMNPAVISDRFIELGPAYQDGPTLQDGDVIPVERSHAPINWDELLESVDMLAGALGPDGGELGRTLEVAADATAGTGEDMNRVIVALSQATIEDATVRLMDQRSGENFVVDDVDLGHGAVPVLPQERRQGPLRHRRQRPLLVGLGQRRNVPGGEGGGGDQPGRPAAPSGAPARRRRRGHRTRPPPE